MRGAGLQSWPEGKASSSGIGPALALSWQAAPWFSRVDTIHFLPQGAPQRSRAACQPISLPRASAVNSSFWAINVALGVVFEVDHPPSLMHVNRLTQRTVGSEDMIVQNIA